MSSPPLAGETTPLALAERARALIQFNPGQARALAERALAAARRENDVEAEVAARYALGWAQAVLGDGHAAITTQRAGIRLAERHGDARGAALLRRHLAVWLASEGHTRAAQREITDALAVLRGRDLAEAQVHRVDIHRRTQSVDPETHRRVCADAAKALRRFRRDGDDLWEARLLFNRGLLRLDRGELDLAETDVRQAHAAYLRAGAETAVANVVPVIAGIAALRGDVLRCLKMLDEVDATLLPGQLGYNLAQCRMLALMQARLLPEARAAAEEYIDLLTRTGGGEFVASALLDLAAIAVMSGDPASADRSAASAVRSFAARGKPVNAALARTAVLRAQLLEGDVSRSSVRSGLAAASVLTTARWRLDALRARTVVARVALASGARPTAREQLELARPLDRQGTVADRIELSHARALLSIADGRPDDAVRLLERGLQLLAEYRAALGAAELRATASGIGTELARAGLRLAIESRDPANILTWGERLRASALLLPAVRPPADPELRTLQAELRHAVAEKAGGRQTMLEHEIRRRSRLVEGDGATGTEAPDVHEAARHLGERVLVEYVEVDGSIRAVTLAGGELSVHELGTNTAGEELEWLRFALGRLAHGRLNAAQQATARESARASAAVLDRLLVRPLLPTIRDAPLVIVPTGVLHGVPWADLPSLRRRPLVAAPSLAVWAGLAQRPRSRRRRAAIVAGPRLRYAAAEARDIAPLRPGAAVLEGKSATGSAALEVLDGTLLAHLACHGHFRADSPLFSSLELADGPLNVYELQSLDHAPEIVVLSACDLALSQLHPGDELLGVAAALLTMGTRTIVASVVPVPDAAARRLMLAFHTGLAGGLAPAPALARAQAGTRTAGFVCLGYGF